MSKIVLEPEPAVVWWRAMDSGTPFGPWQAGLRYGGPVLATVDKVAWPTPGWHVQLRRGGGDQRRCAVFTSEARPGARSSVGLRTTGESATMARYKSHRLAGIVCPTTQHRSASGQITSGKSKSGHVCHRSSGRACQGSQRSATTTMPGVRAGRSSRTRPRRPLSSRHRPGSAPGDGGSLCCCFVVMSLPFGNGRTGQVVLDLAQLDVQPDKVQRQAPVAVCRIDQS